MYRQCWTIGFVCRMLLQWWSEYLCHQELTGPLHRESYKCCTYHKSVVGYENPLKLACGFSLIRFIPCYISTGYWIHPVQ